MSNLEQLKEAQRLFDQVSNYIHSATDDTQLISQVYELDARLSAIIEETN